MEEKIFDSKIIDKIHYWIYDILFQYYDKMISCKKFETEFKGFHKPEHLSKCYYVIVKNIPTPDLIDFESFESVFSDLKLSDLQNIGLNELINTNAAAITFRNVYLIKEEFVDDLSVHFHELVHIFQWQYFGSKEFLFHYLSEVKKYGYKNAPMEKMAYELENHFKNKRSVLNVSNFVRKKLNLLYPNFVRPNITEPNYYKCSNLVKYWRFILDGWE